MKPKILYYDNSKLDWNKVISDYRETLPESERYKIGVICKQMKNQEIKLTQQEREQIARQAQAVARIISQQFVNSILPIDVIKKQESEIVTNSMISRFWDEVDKAGIPHELFKTYARAALKHKLFIDEKGSVCCGGGAGFRFLAVPDDFEKRIDVFLNKPTKKAKSSTSERQDRKQIELFGD